MLFTPTIGVIRGKMKLQKIKNEFGSVVSAIANKPGSTRYATYVDFFVAYAVPEICCRTGFTSSITGVVVFVIMLIFII